MDGDVALKVEVGVLKEKVNTLVDLCEKMDRVIEKLSDNNSSVVNQIYKDMEQLTCFTTATAHLLQR